MAKNNSYTASEIGMGGGIKGATDTDYFYFFCPKCPNSEMMRIIDYSILSEEPENPYNSELSPKAKKSFRLSFNLYCQKCKHKDLIKISNTGWQEGTHQQALSRIGHKI